MSKSKLIINIAIICNIDDLYLKLDNKLLSPILDPLDFHLRESKVPVIGFLIPDIRFKISRRDFSGYHSIIWEYILALIFRKIICSLGKLWRCKGCQSDRVLIKFWINLLLKQKITKIIAIQPPHELCVAANFLKIEIYDLQHGVIALNWYYQDRTQTKFKFMSRPSAVLCWDDISARKINSIWRGVKTKIIGNPWINEFKKNKSDFLGYIKYPISNDSALYKSIKLPMVLLTTQWEPDGFHDIHVTDEIVSLVQTTCFNDISWLIRFHPLEVKSIGISRLHEYAAKKFGLNVFERMHDVSNQPLPAVLMNCSYHITSYSATAIEASLMGIKSGLWTDLTSRKDYFKDYIKTGMIEVLPNNLEGLLKLVYERVAESRSCILNTNDLAFDYHSLICGAAVNS
jgi:hypothetical protein